MPKFFKFMIIVAIFIPAALILDKHNRGEIIRFSANGIVSEIDWESSNHLAPMIKINEGNREVKIFTSSRILLNNSDLKIGDSIIKIKDSRYCVINGIEKLCVMESRWDSNKVKDDKRGR